MPLGVLVNCWYTKGRISLNGVTAVIQSTSILTSPNKDLEGLAITAYNAIKDQIVSLEIPPGTLMSENSLGASLGLSRTPIREALRRLEREYLVAILPRRGIVVTEIDLKSQLQLIEFRRGVEIRLIRRGTDRATQDQRAKFAQYADQMEACAEAGDLTQYIALDSAFDREIDLAASNRFLTDAMQPVHALVRRFWHLQLGKPGLIVALKQHIAVVRAAAEGDADMACKALTELYDLSEKYLFDQLS